MPAQTTSITTAGDRPSHSIFRLTWDMAHGVSNRHGPHLDGADVVCDQCRAVWPCDPRQNADDTMRLMEAAQRAHQPAPAMDPPADPGEGEGAGAHLLAVTRPA